jgi:hypothetical protein
VANSFISSWNLKYAALDFRLVFFAYMLHRVLVSISLWVRRLPSNWVLQSVVFLASHQLQCVSAQRSFISTDLTFFQLSDKAGRSVPAPGRGALTVAREIQSKHPLPILDVAYRSHQVAFRRNQISQWLLHEHDQLRVQVLQDDVNDNNTNENGKDDEGSRRIIIFVLFSFFIYFTNNYLQINRLQMSTTNEEENRDGDDGDSTRASLCFFFIY